MIDFLSVILPTYNPGLSRLKQALAGLQQQTLACSRWELILVDNNSTPPVDVDLSWHPHHQMISVSRQGLTHARLAGFEQAKGGVIVMVDDDNVLDPNYLENALAIFTAYPVLGAGGGKSRPLFESHPPAWLNTFYEQLALRDMGESVQIADWQQAYPTCAPIGAGMCIRKEALRSYNEKVSSGKMIITDRTRDTLSSGGDNDIVLEILKSGWQVGYFPGLILTHIIPEERQQVPYLARLMHQSSQSWVQLLESHQINPWPRIPGWTAPLRKVKAWFVYKAWRNPINYIRWSAACGLFSGLSKIHKNAKT
jgi:glycosyltransferase involved in cell wall biosynthesis